jgi:hypothetical protein
MSEASESPFRTLEVGRADADEARLRSVATLVTLLGAGLFALARPGAISIAVSAAAVAAAVAWAARVRRSGDRAVRGGGLALAPSGLTLAPHPELPWSDVRGVEVDEDRLVVLVHRVSVPEPFVIEPVYDGLSVYDLARLVERCRSFGQSQAP